MRKVFRIVIVFAVSAAILIIVALAVTLPLTRRAYLNLGAAQAKVAHAGELVRERQAYKFAAQEFREAADLFQEVVQELRAIRYLQAVPWISPNLKALRTGAQAAEVASRAIASVLDAGARIAEQLPKYSSTIGNMPKPAREAVLKTIQETGPALQGAKAELALAKTFLLAVPRRGVVGQVSEMLSAFDARVDKVTRVLDEGMPFLEVAPQLLGYPQARQYLLILQNSDEMRPTGGFIGTYGLINIEAGHITDFFTDDVYNLDRFSPAARRPIAPKPLAKYLEQSRWYLRDANWSPDFPTAAEQILRFYDEEKKNRGSTSGIAIPEVEPRQLNGVIAIMPEAIRPLLNIVGPLEVQGQTFTADNLTDALEYEVEIKFDEKGIPRTQRKAIISELGHVLIAKLKTLPSSKWPEVLHVLSRALEEKQLLIYAVDPGFQAVVQSYGWTGNLGRPASDYLGVFDANLFSLKTDPYVTRSIAYTIKTEGKNLIGQAELVYIYPKAGLAWKTKGYRSFTRVYVPKGSILQEATGVMAEEGSSKPGRVEITQEFDKTVFGAFFAVQVGETKRLRFTYRLPENVVQQVQDGHYELLVQKQPGTLGHSLTVSADFGKVPKQWQPTGLNVRREETKLTWQTSLKRDLGFRVELGELEIF